MFALLTKNRLLTVLNGGQWPAGTPEEPSCVLDSVWGCDFNPPEPLGSPGEIAIGLFTVYYLHSLILQVVFSRSIGLVVCTSRDCGPESSSFVAGIESGSSAPEASS
jgi:hypothetical protein